MGAATRVSPAENSGLCFLDERMNIVYTHKHLPHDPSTIVPKDQPNYYSEIPARAEIIRSAVESAGLGPIVPPADHGLDPILAVHDPALSRIFKRRTLVHWTFVTLPGPSSRIPLPPVSRHWVCAAAYSRKLAITRSMSAARSWK